MSLKRILSTFLVGGLACASLWAAEDEKAEAAKSKAALAKAKVTLSQAIETALKATPGGKALGAELELKGETVKIDVDVLTDKGLTEVSVDAVTGRVLKSGLEKVEGKEAEEFEQSKKALPQVKIALSDAIATAEKEVKGGKACEVGMEIEGEKAIVEVSLISGNDAVDVDVDAATGKVLEVEKKGAEEKEEGHEKGKSTEKQETPGKK